MSPLNRLANMAGQMGKFLVSQREAPAVAGIAAHINKFWGPRVRAAIVAHLEAFEAGGAPGDRDAAPPGRCG